MVEQEQIKETLITWNNAVASHNSGNYNEAIEYYRKIQKLSARMRYNMACAQLKLGKEHEAILDLSKAIEQDKHFALAFFHRGTLYLLRNSIMESISDLEMTRALLRGNTFIDYKPLGLLITLTSFQIMNNLALAYVKANKVQNARALLQEALHDADDVQKKSIDISIESLDKRKTSMMQTVHVTTDRVFSPPKSVTQNITKPGIVRRAKVVSAVNADDKNAAFEGSKRVRELKLEPVVIDSTEKAFSRLQRFVKKRLPRSAKSTESNGPPPFNGMKLSKSMNDLQTELSARGCSDLTGNIRSLVKIKRLFQKRTSDSTDVQSCPKMRLNRSCGDLDYHSKPDVSNAVRAIPRSPLSGVRKLLNNKKKVRSRLSSSDEQIPVLVMRESESLGDLRRSNSPPNRRRSEDSPMQNIKSKSLSYEKLNFNQEEQRNSLGSVFGNYLTIVNHTLTRSCDVLTAIVTPTEYENEVFRTEFREDDTNENETESLTNSNKVAHFYINNEELANNVTKTDDETSGCTIKQKIPKVVSTTTKSRPPPPSYPPPPLPPSIVINGRTGKSKAKLLI